MNMITISIVIIEYNSLHEVERCVKSVGHTCKDLDYEIIVSSNSCYPKEKQEKIAHSFPKIRWVFNKKNGGFAYGMDEGLKTACGKYLVIMNPDVIIKSGFSDMIKFMDDHTSVGAIAPQVVNTKGEIQDSCRSYVSLPSFVGRAVKRLVSRKTVVLSSKVDYSAIQTVDWVIGAFMMVRREVYYETEGLDISYFLYAEDVDWCTRIRACGYEIVYYPMMKIVYEGSRAARRSYKYAIIFLHSHFRYWRKFGFLGGYPQRKGLDF